MEYLFIYLLQIADVINGIAGVLGVFIAFFCVGLFINYIVASVEGCSFIPDEDDKKYNSTSYQLYVLRGYLIKLIIISLISTILLFSIPTKQTLLLMGGTYLGKKAVNAVITDEKIKKIDEIINLQLDKYLKELKEQN